MQATAKIQLRRARQGLQLKPGTLARAVRQCSFTKTFFWLVQIFLYDFQLLIKSG